MDELHGSLDRVVADEHNIINYTRKVRQRLWNRYAHRDAVSNSVDA
jgi:hypothetical protein